MRLLTKSCLTLAGGLLLIAVPSRADTFTFNDLTQSFSVSSLIHDGSSDTISKLSCGVSPIGTEFCFFDVSSNDPNATITAPQNQLLAVGEPDFVLVSDLLGLNLTLNSAGTPTGYILSFLSDPLSRNPTCNSLGTCQIAETGQVQPVFSVTWSNGTTDTIQFASDVDTPEPASLILLATGLLGVAGAARRKWLA